MIDINTKVFNPEILYIVEGSLAYNQETNHHEHDTFEMTIVLENNLQMEINQQTIVAKQGDIVILNPHERHIERNTHTEPVKMLHIGLNHLLFIGYPSNQFPSNQPVISLGKYEEELMALCKQITNDLKTPQAFKDFALKINVNQLWLLILRATHEQFIPIKPVNPSMVKKEQLIEEIKYYIENNYAKDLTLEKIAHYLYVTPTYISKIFKEETGDTPINYLINVRMSQAKRLLKNTDLSIKQVSTEVGYEDSLYFSKLFKKNIGLSPSHYASK